MRLLWYLVLHCRGELEFLQSHVQLVFQDLLLLNDLLTLVSLCCALCLIWLSCHCVAHCALVLLLLVWSGLCKSECFEWFWCCISILTGSWNDWFVRKFNANVVVAFDGTNSELHFLKISVYFGWLIEQFFEQTGFFLQKRWWAKQLSFYIVLGTCHLFIYPFT